ncbi:MAG: L-lactate permease, partial [Anaerolineae bacterium]
RWKASRAGIAGWVSALLIAALRFGAGWGVLFWAQVRGLFLALYVLYIIWGALLFYRVTEAAGTLEAIGTLMRRLAPNQASQVLLLAWGLASFFQSVGGFGVPVAIVAPLMVGLGFSPLKAVVIPALGHTWAVSFGSLGSSFIALVTATGLDEARLAPWSAIYLGLLCFVLGISALWTAGGRKALQQGWTLLLVMGGAMASVQYVAAVAGIWNIAAMLGAMAGLFVGSGWALLSRKDQRLETSPALLRKALIPYILLLVIIFAVKFIGPLGDLLDIIPIRARLPAVETARGRQVAATTTRTISLFGHTGALLVYASLITWGLTRRWGAIDRADSREILHKVAKSGLASTLGILSMAALATTMDYAGMLSLPSHTMASIAGPLFPVVSPFIGALGAFVTGSNTNSNVLFGALQRDAAQTLDYTVPLILAAQNAGGALGSMLSPSKVLVGVSTVGLQGKEGETMRRLLRYALLALGILALLTWLLTRIF